MNKYRIIINWSEEDQVFIAEVPELPGCMTHGDTQATARANAKEAIQAWIDTANKFGDQIPKPKDEHVIFNRLPVAGMQSAKANKPARKKRDVVRGKSTSDRK